MCTADAADAAGPAPVLLSFDSLSDEDRKVVEDSLSMRNKERILSGQSKYADVADMTTTYMNWEGKERGLTLEEAEDEVVRYLMERQSGAELAGGLSGGFDPQEVVTFGLLIALLAGVVNGLIINGYLSFGS